MKKALTALCLLFAAHSAISNTTITALVNNGKWRNASTWNLNRTPASGDTVFIPAGVKVILDDNQNLQTATLFIRIHGQLDVNGGRLKMDDKGDVILFAGAAILGHGSNSEQIQMGSVFKFRGTELIIPGPAYANASTGSSPNGFVFGNVTLPVQFLRVSAVRLNDQVRVEWSTAEEFNNSHFEIERSSNGNTWSQIGRVESAGNSTSVQQYSFVDISPVDAARYYRVSQVDQDGNVTFTPICTVAKASATDKVTISSGEGNRVYIRFAEPTQSLVMIRISDSHGRVLEQKALSNPTGLQVIQPAVHTNGIFMLTILDQSRVLAANPVCLRAY